MKERKNKQNNFRGGETTLCDAMFVDTSGSAGCTALAVSREASCGRAALLMRRVAALTVTRTALGGGILMGGKAVPVVSENKGSLPTSHLIML